MSHLDELNLAQRTAVTFGVPETGSVGSTPPLLVIAGAGSGKTMTLAHRVAHLILNGADPRRILLLTFARRMAAEITRRVEHVCADALRGHGSTPPCAIEWSGTFHAVAAKLLRLHADTIGLDKGFSILDRGDAADLIDLVRDELALSETRGRFPKKATCLAVYSYAVNAQLPIGDVLVRSFPWCVEWEGSLKRLFASYVEAKQTQAVLDYDDLLLYWSRMMQVEALASLVSSRFRRDLPRRNGCWFLGPQALHGCGGPQPSQIAARSSSIAALRGTPGRPRLSGPRLIVCEAAAQTS